jgi:hypothetical protein
MSSADTRATETRTAAWARTAEVGTPTEVASAAAEVTAAAANVTAAAANVTAAAANMTATTAARMATATTAASLRRRGSGTGQNDRQNNSQDIEFRHLGFRHGALEARGPR